MKKRNSFASVEQEWEIYLNVSEQCALICVELLKERAKLTEDTASEIILGIVEEQRDCCAHELLLGKWQG